MDYYSIVTVFIAFIVTKKQSQTPATTLMILENFMLTERGQSQEPTWLMIPFTEIDQNRQITEASSILVAAWGFRDC